ncbi:GDYXXLXY domain-containing protein [Pollutibacter soli]|uniref:GDYXXLXY domain-containing protein n=1 Tax=Pollutibacter soli TaxID=3034157 RepID=UPI00301376F4
MKKRNLFLIAINLVLVLAFFAWSVYQKEQTLKNGKIVLLELAPVDPRSLFQGDYMRLDYAISRSQNHDSIPVKGYFVIVPDSNGVAKKIRVQEKPEPLAEGELPLRYTVVKDMFVKVGADSYFFQEGLADYDSARYGGLKVDKNGEGILIGLYDNKFSLIRPAR